MRLPTTSAKRPQSSPVSALALALALSITGSAAAPAFAAEPACPPSGKPGTITITERQLDPSVASDDDAVKSAQRCVLTKAADDDGWRINLVAKLSKKAESSDVNIVFYDQALPKPGEPRKPVQAYPTTTRKGANLMLASVEIKPEDGFKAGGKYSVLITRLVNGREDIYAKTTVELK